MQPNELVKDMYSHLNLIVNELNATGLNKISAEGMVRKIISVLTIKKYVSIVTILHNMED
jgi:hypothetical protein